MRIKILLLVLSVLLALSGFTQSNPSTWMELEFSKKIVKNLKVEFNPELRLFGGFEMDSYILEGGLSYKLHDYLTLAGYYRYENERNFREKREIYEWEPSNRIAFDAKTGVEWKRFDIQFRLRYTNGSDFDESTDNKDSFLRYRGKVGYDIRGSKIVPYLSVEAFHDLNLKYFDKMRYTSGFGYPINKKNEIGLFYRLQDFYELDDSALDIKESMHIIGVNYSLKF